MLKEIFENLDPLFIFFVQEWSNFTIKLELYFMNLFYVENYDITLYICIKSNKLIIHIRYAIAIPIILYDSKF